jgi:hypothetical protein
MAHATRSVGLQGGRGRSAHGNGTPTNRKSASDYLSQKLRPQPHSQVIGNGIATASPAVDLLWEKRVIGDVSDDYGLPPRRRSSHVA